MKNEPTVNTANEDEVVNPLHMENGPDKGSEGPVKPIGLVVENINIDLDTITGIIKGYKNDAIRKSIRNYYYESDEYITYSEMERLIENNVEQYQQGIVDKLSAIANEMQTLPVEAQKKLLNAIIKYFDDWIKERRNLQALPRGFGLLMFNPKAFSIFFPLFKAHHLLNDSIFRVTDSTRTQILMKYLRGILREKKEWLDFINLLMTLDKQIAQDVLLQKMNNVSPPISQGLLEIPIVRSAFLQFIQKLDKDFIREFLLEQSGHHLWVLSGDPEALDIYLSMLKTLNQDDLTKYFSRLPGYVLRGLTNYTDEKQFNAFLDLFRLQEKGLIISTVSKDYYNGIYYYMFWIDVGNQNNLKSLFKCLDDIDFSDKELAECFCSDLLTKAITVYPQILPKVSKAFEKVLDREQLDSQFARLYHTIPDHQNAFIQDIKQITSEKPIKLSWLVPYIENRRKGQSRSIFSSSSQPKIFSDIIALYDKALEEKKTEIEAQDLKDLLLSDKSGDSCIKEMIRALRFAPTPSPTLQAKH